MTRYIRVFLLSIFVMFGLISNAEAAEIASSFTFPVPSYSVTGYDFGDTVYSGVLHLGEDATAAALDPIYASANGRIVPSPITGWHESYGYVVVIEHELPDGDIVYSVSGHMRSEGLMTSGDVSQGDVIGYAGYDDENGDGGPHLHFGIYYGPYSGSWVFYGRGSSTNNWYDPTDFINDHQSTCSTSTSSNAVHLMTVEPQSNGKYAIYGYQLNGSGNSATLSGNFWSYSNTGNQTTTFTWLSGDVNGDGYDDVIQTRYTAGRTYAQVYLSGGTGGLNTQTQWKKTSGQATQAFLADMNADGKADLILGFPNTDSTMTWKYFTSDGVERFNDAVTWSASFGNESDIFVVGDFNGNSKAELLRGRESDGSTGSNFSSSLIWKRLDTSGNDSTVHSSFGYSGDSWLADDVNNDGNDELIRIDEADNDVTVYVAEYSTGSQTFTTITSYANDVGGTNGEYFLYPIDYADGYADLLRFNGSDLKLLQSNGGSAFEEQGNQSTLVSGINANATFLFGDFGDSTSTSETCVSATSLNGDTVDPPDIPEPACPDLVVYYPSLGGWWLADNTCSSAAYHANLFQGMYTQGADEGWYLPVPADFTGDGSTDLVVYTQAGDWSGIAAANNTWPLNAFTITSSYGGSTDSYYPFTGDFDGDGYDDALLYATWGDYYVRLSDGTTFTWDDADWMPSCACGAQDAPETQFRILISDLNGDGRDDLTLYEQTTGVWYGASSTGSAFSLSTWLTGLGTQAIGEDWYHPITGDINGDGNADIGVATSSGAWYMALSTGASFQAQTTWLDSGHGNATSQFFLADMNGDTLADAVVFTPTTGTWTVALSNGVSFATPASWITDFGTDAAGTYNVQAFLVTLVP